MRETLAELIADVVRLTMIIGAGGTAESLRVNLSRELRVPVRLGIEALRRRIDFELQFWTIQVAKKQGDEWDPLRSAHMRQAVRVDQAAWYLTRHLDDFINLPPVPHPEWNARGEPSGEYDPQSGLDGACHLLELHHRAVRVAGRAKLVHRLALACPWCDRYTLARDNGSDVVRCDPCNKRIPEIHYRWFVKVTIAEEQRRRGVVA